MPLQKPTVKDPLPWEKWRQRLELRLDLLVRRLFSLRKGWRRKRDIVENNIELGMRHLSLGNFRDAVFRFKLVTWLEPGHAQAWYGLGCTYLAQEERGKAQAALEKAVECDADFEEAAYMLAVAGGDASAPTRIPESLARVHFDALAPDYEQEQAEARYQGHVVLVEALRAQLPPERADFTVLELGVGTGLCGPLLREIGAGLDGVDFSAPMLAIAARLHDANDRPIYDRLAERELHEFLFEAPAEHYDIIVAANVISYLGELDALFAQVAVALKPGGIFAFTADKTDGESFRFVAEEGRFAFSLPYLQTLAASQGFSGQRVDEAELYPETFAWVAMFAK